MEILTLITFSIITIFSLLNLTLNLFLHYQTKNKLYKILAIFWLALVVNFVLQGYAQNGTAKIIYLFGFGVVPMALLAESTFFILNKKMSSLFYLTIGLIGYALSSIFIYYDFNFTISALPIALAVAIFPATAAIEILVYSNKESSALHKIKGIILALFVIHSLNFAFFRMDPGAQIWGWPVAYALYQLLAAILPAISLEHYHLNEQERLNTLVDKRTEDLQKTNHKLSESLETNKILLRVLLHDLSNPIFIILTKVQLLFRLLKNSLDDKVSHHLSRIFSATERMNSIIDQIREYEAIKLGKKELKLESVHLFTIINKTVESFKEKLENQNITIGLNPNLVREKENLYAFIEEKSFVNSVLSNLLSNAIKFSHPGSIIELNAYTIDNSFTAITIKDYGDGIPQEMQEGLFDFTKKTSRKGTSGESGTGFGLPIVKKYIEFYGGEILVESSEKGGSSESFTLFTLKLKRSNANQIETPSMIESSIKE